METMMCFSQQLPGLFAMSVSIEKYFPHHLCFLLILRENVDDFIGCIWNDWYGENHNETFCLLFLS